MPLQTQLITFACPNCGQTLVGGTQVCQYCGKPTGQAAPQYAVVNDPRRAMPSMNWQEAAYWVLAWIWVAGGVYGVVQALGYGPVLGGFFGPISSLQLLIGFALLTQNTWAIFFAKLLTYLNVIGGLLGVVFSLMITNTMAMLFSLAYSGFQLALACFTIYIFGYMED